MKITLLQNRILLINASVFVLSLLLCCDWNGLKANNSISDTIPVTNPSPASILGTPLTSDTSQDYLYLLQSKFTCLTFSRYSYVGSDRINKPKLLAVSGAHALAWGGSFLALNNAWYRDYPRSSFHFFDDRKEWNQMDKAGHIWTAYQLSRISTEAWYWSGLDYRKSAWLGGASAFAFQSVIEILDGFSSEWGFSVGDMEANLVGSAGFIAQELLFKDQVFQFKLGYRPYDYPDNLKARRDDLFGSTLQEQLLKDYNSQRYWLSGNIKSMFPDWNVPGWLNIAVGYSANGMYGGHGNTWTDKQGNSFDYTHIKRARRFYLAPDIDLTKIRTQSKVLKTVFFVLNSVKIPAPTFEINNSGKMVFRPVMF